MAKNKTRRDETPTRWKGYRLYPVGNPTKRDIVFSIWVAADGDYVAAMDILKQKKGVPFYECPPCATTLIDDNYPEQLKTIANPPIFIDFVSEMFFCNFGKLQGTFFDCGYRLTDKSLLSFRSFDANYTMMFVVELIKLESKMKGGSRK